MSQKKKGHALKFRKLNFNEPSPENKLILDVCRHYVRGQDRALEYIVDALEVFNAGMRNPEKPIFTLLFLGPSGVGKTRVSEVLSKCLFGDFNGFTKIRCAEYSYGHEVSRLTGAPPGYIGHIKNDRENPWAEQRSLLLSQFNIDKFDLIHKLRTGKLMETLALAHVRYQAIRFRHKADLEKQYEELRQKFNSDKKIKKALDELRKNISRVERSLRENDEYYTWLAEFIKKHGAESLPFETLIDIYEKCAETMKFNSIILFDEIEKAHEDFHRHLLEIMDRGVLGVGSGTTSFRNSFIFLTSNVGNKEMMRILSGSGGEDSMGFQMRASNLSAVEDFKEKDQKIFKVANTAAENFFAPEFLGRIDKIVVFRLLDRATMSEIFDLELDTFNQRNLTQGTLGIVIIFTETAKNYVLDGAMKYKSYGARMIEKKLDRILKVGLARLMNQKEKSLVPGDVLWVDLEGEELIFKKEIIESNKPDGGNSLIIIHP